jgi:hypothetical protein
MTRALFPCAAWPHPGRADHPSLRDELARGLADAREGAAAASVPPAAAAPACEVRGSSRQTAPASEPAR